MTLRLTFFFISSITLALVHLMAMEFSLYWKHVWLDMPMHFLGGFCVALGYAIIPFFKIQLPESLTTVWVYLGAVLLVGIAWEVFELFTGISLANDAENLLLDTSVDVVLDLCGGYVAYALIKRIDVL